LPELREHVPAYDLPQIKENPFVLAHCWIDSRQFDSSWDGHSVQRSYAFPPLSVG
jgi:hypothetical protein